MSTRLFTLSSDLPHCLRSEILCFLFYSVQLWRCFHRMQDVKMGNISKEKNTEPLRMSYHGQSHLCEKFLSWTNIHRRNHMITIFSALKVFRIYKWRCLDSSCLFSLEGWFHFWVPIRGAGEKSELRQYLSSWQPSRAFKWLLKHYAFDAHIAR